MPTSSKSTLIAGRYELGEVLGSGGMARVHAGTDRRLRRPVAIKLLRSEMAARPDVRNRFEAEARLAAVIAHPNAVSVYDTGEHDGVPFIVMERLPGQTLADRIVRGPIEPVHARRMARQVLGALESGHASGLVHRDVKPSNILLTADGQAKIGDFGIAKSMGRVEGADPTLTGQLIGTPAYLAPEQLEGVAATPRSDVYSMGVVLYEALTGNKPSRPAQPLASALPGIDATLAAAVDRALSADPTQRFASAGEMGVALAGAEHTVALGHRGAPAVADATMVFEQPAFDPPGPPWQPDGRRQGHRSPGRRAPVLVILLALALAGGLAAVAVVASSRGEDKGEQGTRGLQDPLALQLAAAADGLTPADGARASELADRLRRVASAVDQGGGSLDASDLIAKVTKWERSGELSQPAGIRIRQLLTRVPGVVQPTQPTVAATLAPTTVVPDDEAPAQSDTTVDKGSASTTPTTGASATTDASNDNGKDKRKG
ncbi:MAG: serine/threonine-protein kinase [Acidimicrobiales bacterium]